MGNFIHVFAETSLIDNSPFLRVFFMNNSFDLLFYFSIPFQFSSLLPSSRPCVDLFSLASSAADFSFRLMRLLE